MSSTKTEIAMEARVTSSSNPLDAIPDDMPLDVPYGLPISLDQAQTVIHAAVAEAKKRNWKMNVGIADFGGNLVTFERIDGAMLASIQIACFRTPTATSLPLFFESPIQVSFEGHRWI